MLSSCSKDGINTDGNVQVTKMFSVNVFFSYVSSGIGMASEHRPLLVDSGHVTTPTER